MYGVCLCLWTILVRSRNTKQWVQLCEYVCSILGASLPKGADTGCVCVCVSVCLSTCVSTSVGKAKATQLGRHLFPRL